MRTHYDRRVAALVLSLGVSLAGGESRVRGSEGPGSDYRAALEIARTRRIPVVVIATARDVPASLRLWDEFHDGPWARAHRGLVLVAQVCRESEPQLVQSWHVTRFPTVVVVDPGANGVTVLGSTPDCASGVALAAWLDLLDSGANAPGELDPSVHRTAIGTESYPSGQQPPAAPAPPAAAPPSYSPPAAPAYAVPLATTSAGVIQVPGQNYVIQQAPPQIFMAPAQAPIVYVPQAMTSAMMPVAPANVFLPAVAAPAAPMAAAMPVAAFASAPAMPAAPAVAIPAAVTNQTLALPASQTATRVHVRGPGLFAASLARFGERLVQLGRARIVTTQETVLQPPFPQTASGLTTISTTSAAPIAPPLAPPGPPQPPVYSPQAPPPQPQPSPQANLPRKHFLFSNQ